MRHSSIVVLVIVQTAAFLGTLSLGKTGLISGEVAAFASVIAWFVVGVPLSYSAVDIVARWEVTPKRKAAKAPMLVSNPRRVDA